MDRADIQGMRKFLRGLGRGASVRGRVVCKRENIGG
jgi:hypothetical protein